MANYPIKTIEGIGKKYTKSLQEHGIRSTDKLLEEGKTKKGRESIAKAVGCTPTKVLEWVNRADLYRVDGVAEEISDLLEAAGVDSPSELAQRNAENLAATLKEHNDKKKIVRRCPGLKSVQKYIASAKTLKKVVTH